MVQVLSNWLSSLASLFEEHKAKTVQAEGSIKATLRAARQQFEQADADLEAAFDAAVLSISQGSSESILDQRVEAALKLLGLIEAGYRTYATSAINVVRAYPGVVQQQSDLYTKCVCGLIHVQPQRAAGKDEMHQRPAQAAVMPTPASAAAETSTPSTQRQEQQEQQQQTVARQHSPDVGLQNNLELPAGSVYAALHDLWPALLAATPKPWHKEQQQSDSTHESSTQQPAAAAVASRLVSSTPESTAPAAAAGIGTVLGSQTAASAPGARTTSASGSSKLTAKQQAAAEAAAAAEAVAAAAAAEAAAAVAGAAAPNAPLPCPASRDGMPLCYTLEVPGDVVQASLQQLQVRLRGMTAPGSWLITGKANLPAWRTEL